MRNPSKIVQKRMPDYAQSLAEASMDLRRWADAVDLKEEKVVRDRASNQLYSHTDVLATTAAGVNTL